jgi:hypothetical protein
VSLERIRDRWYSLRENIGIGEICWLATTTAGDEHAERLLSSGTGREGDESAANGRAGS